MAKPLTVVIEHQISGDLEQPRPDVAVSGRGDGRAAYAHEDILCQVMRGLGLADGATKVLEQAMSMRGEERCSVGVHALLPITKNVAGDRSSRPCQHAVETAVRLSPRARSRSRILPHMCRRRL